DLDEGQPDLTPVGRPPEPASAEGELSDRIAEAGDDRRAGVGLDPEALGDGDGRIHPIELEHPRRASGDELPAEGEVESAIEQRALDEEEVDVAGGPVAGPDRVAERGELSPGGELDLEVVDPAHLDSAHREADDLRAPESGARVPGLPVRRQAENR